MNLIGYWIRSLDDNEFPPPQELVSDYNPLMRQKIANYLDAGIEFEVYRGMSWCRFYCDDSNNERLMGHRELTDGVWVWPEGLSHYIRKHNVRLPDEFVATMHANSFQIPTVDIVSSQIVPDLSFWVRWCSRHRSNSLRSAIQYSRDQLDSKVQQIHSERIAARELVEGLSCSKCQWVDCHNHALAGRVLCAACLSKGTIEDPKSLRASQAFWHLRSAIDLRGNQFVQLTTGWNPHLMH